MMGQVAGLALYIRKEVSLGVENMDFDKIKTIGIIAIVLIIAYYLLSGQCGGGGSQCALPF